MKNIKKARLFLFLGCAFFLTPSFLVSSGEKPLLLRAEESHTIHLGDVVSVEKRTLVHGTETKEVEGLIMTPQGESYSGKSFVAQQIGSYQVVYDAFFGYEEEKETITYYCERRSKDFFSGKNATIGFANYRYNTSEKSYSGVSLDVTSGSVVTFDKVLDATSFNSKTPLFDLLIDPSEQGVKDFTALTVRVSNVLDESDYVDIYLGDSGSATYDGVESYVRTGYAGSFLAGREINGTWHTSEAGMGLDVSFRGYPLYNPVRDLKIYFDYQSKAFYGSPAAFSDERIDFINDLDGAAMYATNPWAGFKNNQVKVSLIPSGFVSSSGRILVSSIGGIDLSKETISDTSAPSIALDYAGQNPVSLPKAEVGLAYPLFKGSVSDDIDDDLPLRTSVTYRDTTNGKNIDVAVQKSAFAVTRSGVYTIHYNATDYSGNSADEVTLKIATSDTIEALTLSLPEKEKNAIVYDTVALPNISDLTISGGTGVISTSRHLLDPDGQEIAIPESFVPTALGDYLLRFESSDYLGHLGTLDYPIHVAGLAKPLFIGRLSLPPVLIKGFSYSFPAQSAVETKDGDVLSLTPTLTVNALAYQDAYVASGDKAILTYSVTGVSGTSSVSYTLPIVDTKESVDQAAYFYGGMSAKENTDDIALSASSSSSSVFANRLDTSDFSLYFSFEEDQSNFSALRLSLTDALDSTVSVSFAIDPNKKTITSGTTSASFLSNNDEYRLTYQNALRTFGDVTGTSRGSVLTDDQGKAFSGFGKKGAYLSFSFLGLTSSSVVHLSKLNNQPLGDKGAPSVEKGKPVIVLDQALSSSEKLGHDFAYSTFEAFDVLSDIVSTSLSVKLGTETLLSGSHDLATTFKITSYGAYHLIYETSDGQGNSLTLRKTIFVNDDVLPSLEVGTLAKESYALGEEVTLPSYQASDNLTDVTVDVILFLPDNECRLLTHDENGTITYALTDEQLYQPTFIVSKTAFRTEMVGTYTLRYLAYDSQFNQVKKDLTFTVK